MSGHGIFAGYLCASEFALAIALTVFVIFTVALILLLVFLAVSKSFREVFFREKTQNRKTQKAADKSDKTDNSEKTNKTDKIESQPEPAAPKRGKRQSAAKAKEQTPEYLAAIPTVPLGGIMDLPSSPQKSAAAQKTDKGRSGKRR